MLFSSQLFLNNVNNCQDKRKENLQYSLNSQLEQLIEYLTLLKYNVGKFKFS